MFLAGLAAGLFAGFAVLGVSLSRGGASRASLPRFQADALMLAQAQQAVSAAATDQVQWERYDNKDFRSPSAVRVSRWEINTVDDYQKMLNYIVEKGYAGFNIRGNHAWVFGLNNDAKPSKEEDLTDVSPRDQVSFIMCMTCVQKSRAIIEWKREANELKARDHTEPLCHDYGPFPNQTRTIYMYRAQGPANYNFSNVNAGDIAGVLWYLHHEVVWMCPRLWGIFRMVRKKVTIRQNPKFAISYGYHHFFFGPFGAFDSQVITTHQYPEALVNVGCQTMDYGGIDGHWYSLPGACPLMEDKDSEECKAQNLGGVCDCHYMLGEGPCSYHYEDAGEIDLNEVTGVPGDYHEFCNSGGKEYDRGTDAGSGMDFWNGFYDRGAAENRIRRIEDAFAAKYPGSPRSYGNQGCH